MSVYHRTHGALSAEWCGEGMAIVITSHRHREAKTISVDMRDLLGLTEMVVSLRALEDSRRHDAPWFEANCLPCTETPP